MIDINEIGKQGENESIMYTKYKKFLTFSPWETLAYTASTKVFGNFAYISFCVESEKFPIGPNPVRVKLFVAGIYIQDIPVDEKGNQIKVTTFHIWTQVYLSTQIFLQGNLQESRFHC